MKNNKKTTSSVKSNVKTANSNKIDKAEKSCSTNSSKCRKMWLSIVAILIVTACAVVVLYQTTQANIYAEQQANYKPLSMNINDPALANLNKIDSAAKMEGNEENNILIADKEGSKVFPKYGLNYVVGGDGADEFYYSLCSTDIIDEQVNVIEGFDPAKDKLFLFCAHNQLKSKNIKIIHSKIDEEDVTFIEVQGKKKTTAIALVGNIDIKVSDIILNKRWEY